MRKSEKLGSLSLWSIWRDTIFSSVLQYIYIQTSLHWEQLTNQGREALSNGCEHVRSSTASSAGLLLISLDSSPLDNER
jgi:hypothetical protein